MCKYYTRVYARITACTCTSSANETRGRVIYRRMQQIISSIVDESDTLKPMYLVVAARHLRRRQVAPPAEQHSVYRDVLFLAIKALGQEFIDQGQSPTRLKAPSLPPPCWKRGKKRVSFNGIFVDSRTAAAAPSVCRFDRLSVCPSVCRSDRLSVCPSVRLSAALTVCPSVRPFLESFDGEFLKTYSSFSTRDLAKLTPRDAPPSEAAKQCAKMFGELHL